MNSASSIPTATRQSNFQATSVIVTPRPDELGFALREEEFHVLCGGEIHDARADRDTFLGVSVSAAVGLISLAATTDWDAVLHQARMGPLIWMFILFALVVGPGAAAIQCHRRYTVARDDSACSRLKKQIADYFTS